MIDEGRLRAWLDTELGVEGEPFRVEVISGGASNLTLGVDAGPHRLVVRRPPIGHFLPTAHDMSREYRVQHALRGSGVPVADTLAYCDDESVIGAPFYVMARVDGIVPHSPEPLAGATAGDNARTGDRFVDVLGAIHETDLDAAGLRDFGKPSGFLERQVRRWVEQWTRSKATDEPSIDALAEHLQRTMPVQQETTLVHGDYRLGNVMLDADDTGRIVAVFDWEMATLGDPLTDLGYTLLWWGTRDRLSTHPSQQVADLPGFPSADGVVERYAQQTGRDCGEADWYVALAAFKLAIIGEGQRARLRSLGEKIDEAAGQPLAEWALARR